MMLSLTDEQIQKAGVFIFKNGRLLERKLIEYFFEDGSKQACINALLAYQNPDGGFGNGIDPDLSCPDSTAIGAEFALHILDLLECADPTIIDSSRGDPPPAREPFKKSSPALVGASG